MLKEHEVLEAAAMNWQLCEVYDLDKNRCVLTILPVKFDSACAEDAMKFVVQHAKNRHPLALRALTLIAQYNAAPKKRKKK